MAILVLWKSKEKKLSNIWALLCISVSVWGFGGLMFSTTSSQKDAFFWWQVADSGVMFVPVAYFHFVINFLNLRRKFLLSLVYALATIFLLLNIIARDIFLGGITFIFGQFFWVDLIKYPRPIYYFFYISFYWILLGYAFFLLIKSYKYLTGTKQSQLKYFIFASIIGWIGSELDFLPKFGIYIYPYSNFLIAFYPLIIGYAIVKYRLMDIKIAITRAGIFLAVYTLILGLPFALAVYFKVLLIEKFATNWWVAPLGLMAVLATAGPFLYIHLQRRAENRILREQKRYQDALKHAAVGMTRIHDLKRLLKLIAHIVTRKVGISFTSIYLYDEREGVYSLQVSHDKGRKLIPMVSASQDIIQWFQTKALPLIREEIQRFALESRDKIFSELEVEMKLLEAELIIPSFLDKRLIGFIVLGEKLSGAMYSSDDISVFQVLASQAALAIENAQFYSEAKEMQAQISQAEKMATVGTMADGLSHQINNRFYALSLIAGDTLDTLRLTDATKCSPEVQSMLKEINTALERIQVNVMQGGEVVKGILRYTRKGDEGLVALTMDQIIDGTLDMVQFKVKLNDFDIVRDYLKDMPKIKGNLVQMQEVFFNFIDNAYDSMVERRTMLKEPGYRGKITFSAKPEFGMIKIHITDNGMGVKAEDMKRLFTPFFTTKVSSRKGTGLGLYVIRSIITETHHGKISVQSEHKTGTTFIVELPIFHETTPGHLQNT